MASNKSAFGRDDWAAGRPLHALCKLAGQRVEEAFDLRNTQPYVLGKDDRAEIIKTECGHCFAWSRYGGFREIDADAYSALRAAVKPENTH